MKPKSRKKINVEVPKAAVPPTTGEWLQKQQTPMFIKMPKLRVHINMFTAWCKKWCLVFIANCTFMVSPTVMN